MDPDAKILGKEFTFSAQSLNLSSHFIHGYRSVVTKEDRRTGFENMPSQAHRQQAWKERGAYSGSPRFREGLLTLPFPSTTLHLHLH